MKNSLRNWAKAAIIAAAAFAMSSCYYDPYYGSVGGSYSGGGGSSYGYGYGYGGSNFSTSFFVSTGDPRWGYDPYCYSYYDYHRHCYYDPYLYGYYPVGYRPPVVVGCPHPYGYRSGYCPPPRVVRNVTVVNYNNRIDQYRSSNYGWARQVRTSPGSYSRPVDRHPQQRPPQTRPNTDFHPSRGGQNYYRPEQTRPSGRNSGGYNSNRYATANQGTYPGRQEENRGYKHQTSQGGRQNARTQETRGSRSQETNRKQEPRGEKANPGKGGQGREEETRGNYQGRKSVRYLGQG